MINKPFHIPDTVKVGCFVFKVEQTQRVEKDQALKGQCRHYDKVIRIDSEMQPCDKRETLWHEIIHAVDDFMSLGLSETLVNRLGTAIAMVQVDNPDLFRPESESLTVYKTK